MKFDLFVSDFDGTLGVAPDIITPQTVDAIKKYIKAGGKFVICTGRMFSSIKRICTKYGLNGIVIAYQGATIDDLTSGKRILEGGIDYKLASKVAYELLKDGMPACVDIEDVMYCEEESEYTEFHKEFAPVYKINSIVDMINEKKKPVMKVVTTGETERIFELTKKYQAKYNDKLIVNNGSNRLMEIINPEYSKGSSVKFLSEYYNIPYEKIIAVGDSTNDIELVNGTWHGVAVADGREELKKIAKEITVPFKDDPVKVLLEKYCI